jgi:hypothetical protein
MPGSPDTCANNTIERRASAEERARMQKTPQRAEEQLQWLIDRAQIQDLLVAYARCADEKDWDGFADLYADEGRLVLPFGDITRDQMAASCERVLRPFGRTHHMFSNFAIDIDGDTASSRHYLHATHVYDAEQQGRHADIGGWYDNEYRRTEDGWRFVSVNLTFIWSDGAPFEPGDPRG